MFRALICPSPGVCDYVVELPHWPFRAWFAVCWSLGAVRLWWYPGCRLKQPANVVAQQHSRKLLMMGVLMPENVESLRSKIKIASDI